jgi:LPXTG-motif cell wall-anchored protein
MANDFSDMNGNGEVPPPSQPANNRTFIIAVGVLAGLFVLVLIFMAVYVALILPRTRAARDSQIAQINSANTATVAVLTKVAASVKATQNAPTFTSVPSATVPAATATATLAAPTKVAPTSVVAQATSTSTDTQPAGASVYLDTRTATVAALLTQAAQLKLTTTLMPTTTALPKTGMMEDVGIPSLLGAVVLLLLVIFLVRRMRSSSAS